MFTLFLLSVLFLCFFLGLLEFFLSQSFDESFLLLSLTSVLLLVVHRGLTLDSARRFRLGWLLLLGSRLRNNLVRLRFCQIFNFFFDLQYIRRSR